MQENEKEKNLEISVEEQVKQLFQIAREIDALKKQKIGTIKD